MAEYKLESIINDPRTKALTQVFGESLYAVGGAVRDCIIGRSIKDIDFTVPFLPDEIIKKCNDYGYRVIPTGLSHQTVSVLCAEDLPPVEITSFRTANMSPDGGVFLGKSIEEDLKFRDFRCNAIAFHIFTGNLIDPYEGIESILKKEIICVGNPEDRFLEDPLRILRMVRFCSELGFFINEDTYDSAYKNFHQLSNVSIERIREEFSKILISKYSVIGLEHLRELGFYKIYIPEMETCIDFEQNKFHNKDVYRHTLDVVELSNNSLLLRLAAFFHDIGKPPSLSTDEDGERHFYLHEKIGADMIQEILNRLSYPKQLQQAVKILIYTHMRPIDAGKAGLKRILRDTEPYYEEWRDLKEADTVAVLGRTNEVVNDFKKFDERIQDILNSKKESNFRSLEINGNDLINLGIRRGPIYKDILKFCEELVIENADKNSKEMLIAEIKSRFADFID